MFLILQCSGRFRYSMKNISLLQKKRQLHLCFMFLILLSLSQHKASLATSSGSSNREDCHQNNTVTGNLKYGPIIIKKYKYVSNLLQNLKRKFWCLQFFKNKNKNKVYLIHQLFRGQGKNQEKILLFFLRKLKTTKFPNEIFRKTQL